ncbi:ATP-dependent helicase [Brevibacterium album]|uniref:ATP-dependent helicase n=1 Tax=Brevibacterium album TaxID=417948 RepID=UPI000421C6FF|nr:UvrD-helicase domain-containing protein [Brevibacterium album]
MRGNAISAVELADLLGANRPTEEQQRIIEAPLESAVVIAGAGSGKTTVISLRVVWLVANGLVAPDRVLGLTFTRKAVGELNERVRTMLARYRRAVAAPGTRGAGAHRARARAEEEVPGLDLPVISTYNSYAASLVADHGMEIGLEAGEGVLDAAARQELADAVLDSATSAAVVPERARSTMSAWMTQMLGEMGEHLVDFEKIEAFLGESVEALCTPVFLRGLAKAVRRRRSGPYQDKAAKTQFAAQLEDAADELEAAGRGPGRSAALARARPLVEAHEQKIVPQLEAKRRIVGLARSYADAKRERGGMEFSDQVSFAHRIMTTSRTARETERSRWDVVLLDEYQDTSYSQLLLLRELFARLPVMAVGDPRQAIYGWRGASADNITSFAGSFRGPADVPAAKYGLMTSWRNDEAILTAANRIARGLDTEDERRGLAARPGAGPGAVEVSLTQNAVNPGIRSAESAMTADGGTGPEGTAGPESTAESGGSAGPDGTVPPDGAAELAQEPPSQLEELVSWVLRVREELREEARAAAGREGAKDVPEPTVAVLCRNRSGFGHVAAALEDAGLPVEALGVRGLLEDPFVADALAALEVLVDPDAGNVLMRLLTGRMVRLGAADVHAFSSFVRSRAVAMPDPEAPGEQVEEGIGVVEGLDELLHAAAPPVADAARPEARRHPETGEPLLSAEGHRRLVLLARSLRRLRSANLTLTGLLRAVIRELGIDTEIAALAPAHERVHQRQLDGFLAVASGFVAEHPAGGPRDLLAWLRVMEAADEIGETTPEPAPGSVTVMTVHASKGLEFDAVAVPFMHAGGLPSARRSKAGWLAGGALPYPLRGDSSRLPPFDLREMGLESPADFEAALGDDGAVGRALEAHHRSEERRLAYVALTRARKRLFVSASRFTIGRTRPVEDFPFLAEVAESLGLTLPELPEADPVAEEAAAAAVWPASDPAPLVRQRAARLSALRTVRHESPRLEDLVRSADSPRVRALAARALQLLDEESRAAAPLELPSRLSATAMVGLSADAAGWWADQLRPMPEAPSVGAELGTAFHAWVERHYGQAALLDMEAGETAARLPAAAHESFDRLRETFSASAYAARTPAAVELSFELVLDRGPDAAALHVPGKIDAVFREDDGRVLVVDWKTGRRPTDPERLRHMELQLAVYHAALMRMPAYADAAGIDAEFYFVGSDEVWRAERLMGEEELIRWLREAEAGSARSAG